MSSVLSRQRALYSRQRNGIRLLGLCLLLATSCYRGGEREKEPPPGYPGGFCLAPNGTCHVGTCDVTEGGYCYDATEPCTGFFCGSHGACLVTAEGKPSCACDPGYSNEVYPLFCDPENSSTSTSMDTGMDDGMDTGLPDMGG